MAATSDERHEVAEKLRQASHTDTDFDVTIAIAILETIGEVHRPIAAVVADLIDPTCHKVIPSEIEGYVFCSKCGAEIGEYGVPNYCPNCGARVVPSAAKAYAKPRTLDVERPAPSCERGR